MSNNKNIVIVTDSNFEALIAEDKLVMIDFYTEWCGPCKMLTPIIVALADEYKDRVIVGKLNAEENIKVSEEYEVYAVPVIFIFKNGKVLEKIEGFKAKEKIKEVIEKYL